MGKRIEREKQTIGRMIGLYQRRCPEARDDAEHYQALNAYADKRLDKCVFGDNKPACKQCPVHCYQPAKREEMKQIMRWAGPRMLWRHPILTPACAARSRRTTRVFCSPGKALAAAGDGC